MDVIEYSLFCLLLYSSEKPSKKNGRVSFNTFLWHFIIMVFLTVFSYANLSISLKLP